MHEYNLLERVQSFIKIAHDQVRILFVENDQYEHFRPMVMQQIT